MIKTLAILFILSICFCKADSQSFRFLSSEVTDNGYYIPIRGINGTMHVLVDFAYQGERAYKMVLSFAVSETIFMNNISDSAVYECKPPYCFKPNFQNNEFQFTIPESNFRGYRVLTSLYLSNKFWNFPFSEAYKPIVAINAWPFRGNFGKGYSGVLGMGAAKNGRLISQLFSVYIGKGDSGGYLIFGTDERYIESKIPVAVLRSDENWNVGDGSKLSMGGKEIIPGSYKLIFDINNENIMVPNRMYDDFIAMFKAADADCSHRDYFFQCGPNLRVDKLPTVNLHMNGTILRIPPNVYVVDYNPNVVVQNIKTFFKFHTTGGLDAIAYVFQDYIILGRNFMRNHYVVFDNEAQKIIIYTSKATPPSKPTINTIPTNLTSAFKDVPIPPPIPGKTEPEKTDSPKADPSKGSNSSDKTPFLYIIIAILSLIIVWGFFSKKSSQSNAELLEKLVKLEGKTETKDLTSNQQNQASNSLTENETSANNVKQNTQINPSAGNENNANLNAQFPNQFSTNGNNFYRNVPYPNQFYGNVNFNQNGQVPNSFTGNAGFNYIQYPNPFTGNGNNVNQNVQFLNPSGNGSTTNQPST